MKPPLKLADEAMKAEICVSILMTKKTKTGFICECIRAITKTRG